MCDRVPPPVALARECSGSRALAVVEHFPAAIRDLWRHVDSNDPDADEIGHERTPAISAATLRTPSSIWPVASALQDSLIAWLPPPAA